MSTITRENAGEGGSFSQYRKVATTRISDFTVPPGVTYQTPEGLHAEDEHTRIAFDVQGGVYPIRESVFQASYARATPAPTMRQRGTLGNKMPPAPPPDGPNGYPKAEPTVDEGLREAAEGLIDDYDQMNGEGYHYNHEAIRAALRRLDQQEGTSGHPHNWVDMTNKYIDSGEWCPDCGKIRSGQESS